MAERASGRKRDRAARVLERLREKALERPGADEFDAYYAELARKVAEQRLSRELSQAELAELCGTTQSAIARLESGERPPRIDTLLRIANALDCELEVELRPRTRTRKRGGDEHPS